MVGIPHKASVAEPSHLGNSAQTINLVMNLSIKTFGLLALAGPLSTVLTIYLCRHNSANLSALVTKTFLDV